MDVRFREVPGQDDWGPNSGWPSSNTGWRFGVFLGAALILLAIPLLVIGMAL